MGRRKIEMKMVRDSSTRQVTFSKRRTGLFKKANELATLCGSEVAIVVFSPGGKPFSYGNPCVETVARRYLDDHEARHPTRRDHRIRQKTRETKKVERMNETLNGLLTQLQAQKERGEELDEMIKASGRLNKPLSDLNQDELVQYRAKLEELKAKIMTRAVDIEASQLLMCLSRDKKPRAERNRNN